MPRAANPPVPLDPRKQAQVQQETAMAGLADFDLPRTVVTRLAKAQVGRQSCVPVIKLAQQISLWFRVVDRPGRGEGQVVGRCHFSADKVFDRVYQLPR